MEATARVFGHQVYSAKFCCHKCEITQSDLAKISHAKKPHNFKTVDANLRSAESYDQHFKSNCEESLKQKDEHHKTNEEERKLRANGKKHKSVIGPAISPFSQHHCIDAPVHLKIGEGNSIIDQICEEIESEFGEDEAECFADKLEEPWRLGGLGVSKCSYHGAL